MKWRYYLEDLVRFFQRQMKDKFVVIEALVNLYEFELIADEEKIKLYLETLRKYGLYEIGYKGPKEKFFESHREIPLPEDPPKLPEEEIVWEHFETPVQMEYYNVTMINGVVEFRSIMN